MKFSFGLLVILIIGVVLVSGCISTPPITSPATMPPSLDVYGELTEFVQGDDVVTFRIQPDFVNYELNDTYVEVDVNANARGLQNISYPIEGNDYAFYFVKTQDGSWDVSISEDFAEYMEKGKVYHEKDLSRDEMTTTGEAVNGTAQIFTTIIQTDQETELEIQLTNNQDVDITYRITEANIVNEEASQWYGNWWNLPPYEERLKNAIIDDCDVSFDSSEYTLPSGESEILTFTVNCPSGIDISRDYETCDNYEERRNCRTLTADRTDNLMLWGTIEFTDELGNVHTFPEKGILKQFLEIE